jgi:acetyl esterase/lipase
VNDPMLSPLLGNLAALPRTLIQVSRDEMLYGDSQRYANKAKAHGSEVTLQVWPRMVHVPPGFCRHARVKRGAGACGGLHQGAVRKKQTCGKRTVVAMYFKSMLGKR